MPEGKILTFSTNEYPEMEGHKDGTSVTINIKGKIQNQKNQSSVGIKVSSFVFDAGNSADKEMESMTGKKEVAVAAEPGEDDF